MEEATELRTKSYYPCGHIKPQESNGNYDPVFLLCAYSRYLL